MYTDESLFTTKISQSSVHTLNTQLQILTYDTPNVIESLIGCTVHTNVHRCVHEHGTHSNKIVDFRAGQAD